MQEKFILRNCNCDLIIRIDNLKQDKQNYVINHICDSQILYCHNLLENKLTTFIGSECDTAALGSVHYLQHAS